MIKRFIHLTIVQHLVFWVLSFLIVTKYFSISNEITAVDLIYALFLHIPIAALVYVNLRLMIPYFLSVNKWLLYFLGTTMNLLMAYTIHEFTFDWLIPRLPLEYFIVSFVDFWSVIFICLIYLGTSTLLKLSKSWFEVNELTKEKAQLELSALKNQVNPHFLFNSLNSIYALSRKKSDHTTQAILELSDLLRFMLYKIGDDQIQLKEEITLIENYINIEKLRLEESSEIKFTIEGEVEGVELPPLILFPWVENAFKHGDGEKLEIHLKVASAHVYFVIQNSVDQEHVKEEILPDKSGGLGIKNIQQRLELLFPEKHDLKILNETNSFNVELNIDL